MHICLGSKMDDSIDFKIIENLLDLSAIANVQLKEFHTSINGNCFLVPLRKIINDNCPIISVGSQIRSHKMAANITGTAGNKNHESRLPCTITIGHKMNMYTP